MYAIRSTQCLTATGPSLLKKLRATEDIHYSVPQDITPERLKAQEDMRSIYITACLVATLAKKTARRF